VRRLAEQAGAGHEASRVERANVGHVVLSQKPWAKTVVQAVLCLAGWEAGWAGWWF
jgi:hypothetical protein